MGWFYRSPIFNTLTVTCTLEFAVDDPEQLDEFAYLFNSCFKSKFTSGKKVGLIIFVESVRALIQLEHICLAAKQLENKSALVAECLVFGSDDFVADIGATRTTVNINLHVVIVGSDCPTKIKLLCINCTFMLLDMLILGCR